MQRSSISDYRRAASRTIVQLSRRAAYACLDGLAPEICLFCQQLTEDDISLCSYCCDLLKGNSTGCPCCALPDCAGQLCPPCQAQTPALDQVIAPFVYDEAIALFMQHWKYQGTRRLAKTAASLMTNNSNVETNADIWLATPLHWRRQLGRGFNQSEDLLQALARLSPINKGRPLNAIRIHRQRATPSQAGASRRERLRNLRDAFMVRGDVRDRSVVVIDDVCTTGATGNAVAQSLRKAGAREVRLWCLARTPAP